MTEEKTKRIRISTEGGRKFRFELSPTGLIGVLSLALLGVIWVFIFGVLVGRGYRPENSVPEIASVMPKSAYTPSEAPKDEILKPEELEFFDSLKEQTELPKQPAQKTESGKPTAEQEQPKQKPAEKPAASAQKSPPAPENKQASSDNGNLYAFVYQTASFKKKDKAVAFEKRVKELGLDTELEQARYEGDYWYRVLVRVRGTENDAEAVKTKIRTLGTGDPLLRAKKSVKE